MPYPESTFICKTLCCVWFQQHIESPFAYSKLDLPSFYTSINCPTLLAVKILIFLMPTSLLLLLPVRFVLVGLGLAYSFCSSN